jgi:hypothetical protein
MTEYLIIDERGIAYQDEPITTYAWAWNWMKLISKRMDHAIPLRIKIIGEPYWPAIHGIARQANPEPEEQETAAVLHEESEF